MSRGPLAGSRPSAKTAGKITRPANRPAAVSADAVHSADVRRFSPRPRYEPYTTISVPPSPIEKTACPSAATITRPVRSPGSNFRRYQPTPANAPGSVSERTISTSSTTNISGMSARLARSMPARNPFSRMTATATSTALVNTSCSEKERASKPSAGGSTAAGENSAPSSAAISASPKHSTQPIATQ